MALRAAATETAQWGKDAPGHRHQMGLKGFPKIQLRFVSGGKSSSTAEGAQQCSSEQEVEKTINSSFLEKTRMPGTKADMN